MDKKFFLSLGLSLITVWSLQYFWGHRADVALDQSGSIQVGQESTAQEVQQGQPLKIAAHSELLKPLGTDASFVATKFNGNNAEELIDVSTDLYRAVFSTHGGQLVNLDFLKHTGRQAVPLRTVHKKSWFDEAQRPQGTFLLTFQADAPFVYQLEHAKKTEVGHEVVLRAQHAGWQITKQFVLYNDSYKIDCTLAFAPVTAGAQPLEPRLFVAAPFVPEVHEDAVRVCTWLAKKQQVETTDIAKASGLAWFWRDTQPLMGIDNKFFVHALVADDQHFVQRAYVRTPASGVSSFILEGKPVAQEQSFSLSFYFGPKVFDRLVAVDNRLEQLLAFGWFSTLCKWLILLLEWLYQQLGNFGWAIIALAVVLKLPFTPLSMYARKRMEVYQRYQPTLMRIRQKYKHDVALQHQETMKFLKDHGMSPATQMIGCLPLLMQMPILFALYRVLSNYLGLYQAPFIGWIHDLSASDPYYVLPILMGASMLVQQSMVPSQADDKQRLVMVVMTLVFTAFFARFPAGLVLYYLANNVLTMAEDLLRKRVIGS